MNTSSELSDSTELIPTDIEFFKLAGLVPDASVSLQAENFALTKYPATVSLLACSSKHGHFSAATNTGFVFGQTKALRSTFYKTEKRSVSELEEKIEVALEKPVQQVRYSAEEDKLLIALTEGELLVYAVSDIQANKDQVKPIHTYTLGTDILDLRPNPEALPHLTAVLFQNHQCILLDINTGDTQSTLPLDNITAICWSPKGKQIVCGKQDGSLQHFDVEGVSKDALSIPEAMQAGQGEEQENRYVQDVLWIENHIFLVMYARPRHNLEEDDYINDGYIINRKPTKDSTEPEYIRLAEITPIFGTDGRGNHFYMETIRGLGKEIKHLVILANAATSEISFVGEAEDGTWSTWQPSDGLLNLPLSQDCMDTYPMGLALDFSADEKLSPIDAGDSDTSVEPVPVFYYLNDESRLGAHHCYNTELARRGESYKSTATEAATQSATTTPTAATAATAAPSSAFGSSAFGSSAFGSSAFGSSAFGAATSGSGSFADLLSGKATAPAPTSNGFTGFGSTSSGPLPSFSNLGSAPKLASGFGGLSSFGGSATNTTTPSKPTFGSTTSFGAAAGTAPSTDINKSFGGFNLNKSTEANQTTLTSSTDKQSKPSSTTEQNKTETSDFGSFGSLAKNTTADAKPATTAPAFGSTSTLGGGSGGFGALAKSTAAPAFGSTSTLGGSSGGFGSLAKNTTADAKPATTAPAFGSTSTLGSGSGSFAALAKNTVPGAKSPSSAPSLFASNTTTSGGFGTSTSFGSLSKPATSPTPTTAAPTAAPTTAAPTTATPTTATPTTAAPTTAAPTTAAPTTAAPTTAAPTTAAPTTPPTTTTNTTTKTTPSTSILADTSSKTILANNTNILPSIETPASSHKSAVSASPPEKEKPKVTTVEDGMAKQYESLYLTVEQDIETLKKYHQKLSLMMKLNTTEIATKTREDLAGEDVEWNLSDAAQMGVISDELLSDAQRNLEEMRSTEMEVNKVVQNCRASMDRKEDIAYLLNKDVDHDVVDIMDNRDLDEEAKTLLRKLESRSDVCGSSLNQIECKFQENKKRNKIRNDYQNGELSLYSLHRAVRDIERELVEKSKDIAELETKLTNYKLVDSEQKAKRMPMIDDDDEEQEEVRVTTKSIQHAARYLRRYNFMDHVCGQTSIQKPVETHVHV